MTNEQKMTKIDESYHVVGVKKIAYGTLVTLDNGAKITLYDKGTHRVQNDLPGEDSVKKWLDNDLKEEVCMDNTYYVEADFQDCEEETTEITKLYVLEQLSGRALKELLGLANSKHLISESVDKVERLIVFIQYVDAIVDKETLCKQEAISQNGVDEKRASDSYMSTVELIEELEKRVGVSYCGVGAGEYAEDIIGGLEIEGPATILIVKD